ncbi:hypothetical protein [Clostridium botulinum]|uniref:hypothetical protein n=1 Tax=Clostridium botulinum TaxID=1491 RepID=UPI0007746EE1|nr:hypothetical protein [Clostridium botulinum]
MIVFEEKKKIIINTIIALVCVFGGLLYLAYNILTNKSQLDIAWSYWLIFSFILAFIMFPVVDYIKYKKNK